MNKSKFSYILIIVSVIALVIGLGLISALATESDGSDPLQDYRDQQAELNEQMDELEAEIAAQSNLIAGYENDIASIEAQMLIIQEELALVQASIDEANDQIAEAEIEIADAEVRLAKRQAYLEERLLNTYIHGDITMLDVVFETDSFEEFIVMFDMVGLIVDQDRYLLNEIEKEKQIIADNKALMEQRRDDLVVMADEYESKQGELESLQNQKVSAMNGAISTKEGYVAMLDELEAASAQVGAMIREYLSTSGDALTYGGSMIWPLPSPWGINYLTSDYGYRTHPVWGTTSFHTGIDIGANGGTPIYAVADGVVISRGWLGGYGNTIQINHGDGITTLYAHQSAFGSYGVGDTVLAGDTIGYVGTTGWSTGNHLHFEVRVNGSHTSPWNYLN